MHIVHDGIIKFITILLLSPLFQKLRFILELLNLFILIIIRLTITNLLYVLNKISNINILVAHLK